MPKSIESDKRILYSKKMGNLHLGHHFVVSTKLTVDSLLPGAAFGINISGENTYRKVGEWIGKYPDIVWHLVYKPGSRLRLASCAYRKLTDVVRREYPELYSEREKKKQKREFQRKMQS